MATTGGSMGVIRPEPERGRRRLDVRLLAGPAALRGLGDDWDALVERQPLPSITLTSSWLRRLDGGGNAFLAQVRREGRLVAAGAFRRLRLGPLPAATWLGGARLTGVLAEPGEEAAAAEAVRAVLDRCRVLWLPRIPALGPTAGAVDAVAPWRRANPVLPGGYVVELPPARLEHARSKTGYELRRAERKGAAVAVETHRDGEELLAAFARLGALYRARWRGREEQGDRHSDILVQSERYRTLLPELAPRGQVRMVEVFEDGRLVASLLGFLAGRGALFHTTATEPGGALRGPGHVVMLGWVEEATAAGAEVMYLGRGAGEPEGPKARLGASELGLTDVLVARTPRLQRMLETAAAVAAPVRRGLAAAPGRRVGART